MIDLAKLEDAYCDTYVVEQCNDGSTWIDLYKNKWKRPIRVIDALKLIDESGLNTTANDLRAKLEEANATIASLHDVSTKNRDQFLKLAADNDALNRAIASLRQRDTVRPEALAEESLSLPEYVRQKQFAAWGEGYEDGQDEMAHDYAKAVNPYGEP